MRKRGEGGGERVGWGWRMEQGLRFASSEDRVNSVDGELG